MVPRFVMCPHLNSFILSTQPLPQPLCRSRHLCSLGLYHPCLPPHSHLPSTSNVYWVYPLISILILTHPNFHLASISQNVSFRKLFGNVVVFFFFMIKNKFFFFSPQNKDVLYVGHFKSLYLICYHIASGLCFDFWPQGMCDFSSLSRAQTCNGYIGWCSHKYGTPRKILKIILKVSFWNNFRLTETQKKKINQVFLYTLQSRFLKC